MYNTINRAEIRRSCRWYTVRQRQLLLISALLVVLYTEISDQTLCTSFLARFWSIKSFKTSECESRIVGRSPNFAISRNSVDQCHEYSLGISGLKPFGSDSPSRSETILKLYPHGNLARSPPEFSYLQDFFTKTSFQAFVYKTSSHNFFHPSPIIY